MISKECGLGAFLFGVVAADAVGGIFCLTMIPVQQFAELRQSELDAVVLSICDPPAIGAGIGGGGTGTGKQFMKAASAFSAITMVWLRWIGNMQIYLGRGNGKLSGIL